MASFWGDYGDFIRVRSLVAMVSILLVLNITFRTGETLQCLLLFAFSSMPVPPSPLIEVPIWWVKLMVLVLLVAWHMSAVLLTLLCFMKISWLDVVVCSSWLWRNSMTMALTRASGAEWTMCGRLVLVDATPWMKVSFVLWLSISLKNRLLRCLWTVVLLVMRSGYRCGRWV